MIETQNHEVKCFNQLLKTWENAAKILAPVASQAVELDWKSESGVKFVLKTKAN